MIKVIIDSKLKEQEETNVIDFASSAEAIKSKYVLKLWDDFWKLWLNDKQYMEFCINRLKGGNAYTYVTRIQSKLKLFLIKDKSEFTDASKYLTRGLQAVEMIEKLIKEMVEYDDLIEEPGLERLKYKDRQLIKAVSDSLTVAKRYIK